MPSDSVPQGREVIRRILGEAELPKPSAMSKQLNPRTGAEGKFKWRMHKVLGVAPTGVNAEAYEEWLEDLNLKNVEAEHSLNNMTMSELLDRIRHDPPADPAIAAFLVEVEQLARHTGADEIAFTDLEGLA